MAIEITNLSENHRAGLHDLLVAEGWMSHAERLATGAPDSRTPERYVALLAGTVVGFVEGTFTNLSEEESGQYPPPRAWVESLLVSSTELRHGIGSALLRRFAADAEAAGRSSVMVFPNPFNAADRLAFFEACGYSKIDGVSHYGASLQTVLTCTHTP